MFWCCTSSGFITCAALAPSKGVPLVTTTNSVRYFFPFFTLKNLRLHYRSDCNCVSLYIVRTWPSSDIVVFARRSCSRIMLHVAPVSTWNLTNFFPTCMVAKIFVSVRLSCIVPTLSVETEEMVKTSSSLLSNKLFSSTWRTLVGCFFDLHCLAK